MIYLHETFFVEPINRTQSLLKKDCLSFFPSVWCMEVVDMNLVVTQRFMRLLEHALNVWSRKIARLQRMESIAKGLSSG